MKLKNGMQRFQKGGPIELNGQKANVDKKRRIQWVSKLKSAKRTQSRSEAQKKMQT